MSSTDLCIMKLWWRYSRPLSNWRTIHFTWIKNRSKGYTQLHKLTQQKMWFSIAKYICWLLYLSNSCSASCTNVNSSEFKKWLTIFWHEILWLKDTDHSLSMWLQVSQRLASFLNTFILYILKKFQCLFCLFWVFEETPWCTTVDVKENRLSIHKKTLSFL